ncbi:hypothetical protein ACFSQQ_27775 [Mesorhizobium kowhaii]|uniref:ATP-dependent DNA ligase n=1 Tax=Mesorhizobium kowhaii TaxID=1300272 RepID=UPI0035E718D6
MAFEVNSVPWSEAIMAGLPLVDRRDILQATIPAGARIQFSEALPGDAKAIFHLIDQAGLEGMVSKRNDSVYRSGNSTAWLKTKSLHRG